MTEINKRAKRYSINKAAKSLGVSDKTIDTWKKQYQEGRLIPGMKRAQATPEEQELRRLKEELRQVKMENEILKKVTESVLPMAPNSAFVWL